MIKGQLDKQTVQQEEIRQMQLTYAGGAKAIEQGYASDEEGEKKENQDEESEYYSEEEGEQEQEDQEKQAVTEEQSVDQEIARIYAMQDLRMKAAAH